MQHPARHAHEHSRWMRPDAARWVRPDAARFLKPGTRIADVYPALDQKYNPNQPRVPAGNSGGGQWTSGGGNGNPRVIIDTTDWGSDADVDAESSEVFDDTSTTDSFDIDPIFDENRDSALDAIFSNHDDSSIYDPSPVSRGESITDPRIVSDADPFFLKPGQQYAQVGSGIRDIFGGPYYDRGGHHEMPRGVYEKWDLQSETRKVFNDSTTGRLPGGRSVESPSGKLPGHYWSEAHKEYNIGVRELSERFMERRGLTPKSMSPDDAKELLRDIRTSEDPRIRDFNRNIRMLRRVFRLDRGRE